GPREGSRGRGLTDGSTDRNRRDLRGLTSGDALRLHQGQEKEHGQDFDDFRDDTERVEILDVPNRPHGDCPCDDVGRNQERGHSKPRPVQITTRVWDEERGRELEAREHSEERRWEWVPEAT